MRRASPRLALALAVIATVAGCSSRAGTRPAAPGRVPASDADRTIRVALVVPDTRISATKEFGWFGADGRTLLTRGRRGEQWRIERERPGARVRALRPDGVPTAWQASLVMRANDDGLVTLGGRRYRGHLVVLPLDTAFVVVNWLHVEDYLRGVVPVEMGTRPREDSSALQAQAVASRSFALTRTGDARRAFDVRATTQDQVYGGANAENARASAAVDATRGLVLRYQGRVVDAPFHATCGGTTAEAPEVWRTAGSAYLQRVSDRVGSSARYYCDMAPRYRWTRTLSAEQLNGALERYLQTYASVPGGRAGTAQGIEVKTRTASGRVAILEVGTDKGTFPLRANDIRYVMREPGGEILYSTYFSVATEYDRTGHLERVTFRGQGNGHGVGMCQWGAIGRARSGQSFRDILGTYYPGTTVGPVN